MEVNDFGQIINYSDEELLARVKANMSPSRFKHVLGVEKVAIQLAERYGADVIKARIAALTHDYAKERKDDEFIQVIRSSHLDEDLLDWGNFIWHGFVGATIVQQELGINDEEILQAIRLHTTGAKEMTLLDKIIYVADYIEEGRTFPGVDKAREIAFSNLDQAVAFETKQTLAFLLEKETRIYPKTIETYNTWAAKQ